MSVVSLATLAALTAFGSSSTGSDVNAGFILPVDSGVDVAFQRGNKNADQYGRRRTMDASS
jgi:hypothetical protein